MAEENIDRGDTIPDTSADDDKLPPSTIDDGGDAEPVGLDAVDDAGDEGDKDDQPRGKDGKFQKKEAPDHVPKSRFDEAVNKERAAREAAERRAAELEAKVRQEEKSADVKKLEESVDEMETKYNDLVMDGEKEKAREMMKQIRLTERKIAEMMSDEKTTRATARAVEQVRMEAAIAKLESDYPQFNKESEDFDQDLVDLTLAEHQRLMEVEKMSPSAALLQAGMKIMKKMSPAAAADKEGARGLAAAAKGADRKAGQVSKNLDTAKRQPASMKASGKDSDQAGETKIDVSTLTPSEFNALPETTKARLRGDFL